jgi:hypothetical protein
MVARTRVLGTLAMVLSTWALAEPASAQALRKFEEPHSPSPPSTSSSSSSNSSSSSSSSFWSGGDPSPSSSSSSSWPSSSHRSGSSDWNFLAAIGTALYEVGHDARPSSPSEQPKTFLGIDPYADSHWGAYTRKWTFNESEGQWERRDNAVDIRGGELKLNAFMATAHTVYASDVGVRGYLQLFVAQASWERFYEPRPEVGRTDTLDMFRAHVGPNIFGSMLKEAEVYVLAGGAVMKGQNAPVPAFDIGIEARAYPVRPFALYGSGFVSIFGNGPALVDGRFEVGVAVGRFDIRGGIRMLKQEPEQSFFGPIASVTLRF